MFANQVKDTVEISIGQVGIRMLSWKSLEKAAEQRLIVRGAQIKSIGGEVIKQLQDEKLGELAEAVAAIKTDPKAQAAARYDTYDRETVLIGGVETFNGEKAKPSQILELQEGDAKQLHEAILDLSLPTPEKVEEAQGKS